MTPSAPVSERTCVGCRRVEPQLDLVRLALGPGGQVAVDHPRRLGGRGAWVHASAACVRQAVTKGGLSRGLGCGRTSFSADELLAAMRRRFETRARSLLSAARRANEAEVGSTAVVSAMRAGRARLVVVATDAAAGADEVESAARAAPVPPPSERFETKSGLGAMWSRDTLAVVAVTDAKLAAHIGRELEWVRRLS